MRYIEVNKPIFSVHESYILNKLKLSSFVRIFSFKHERKHEINQTLIS